MMLTTAGLTFSEAEIILSDVSTYDCPPAIAGIDSGSGLLPPPPHSRKSAATSTELVSDEISAILSVDPGRKPEARELPRGQYRERRLTRVE